LNIQSKSKLPFPVEPGHDRRPVAGWLLSATGHVIMYVLGGGFMVVSGLAMEQWGEFVGSVLFVLIHGTVFSYSPCLGWVDCQWTTDAGVAC